MIPHLDVPQLDPNIKQQIKDWAQDLGFQQAGITDIDLSRYEERFLNWLKQKFHGEMQYMEAHGSKRYRPEELIPGTISVISLRIDYMTAPAMQAVLEDPTKAYLARYALGRDYHRLIRKRLQLLADRLTQAIGPFGYRVFADSAPVLEKPLAEKAGLGWMGKHTNLINKKEGSWFFLGEIFTDLPLVSDEPATGHCGTCTACLQVCPTQAIIGPYQLDARRCISYLTIELRGSIPLEFRPLIGNRVFGCDDCQLFCPWNRFAKPSAEADFQPRHGLEAAALVDLFAWTEKEFLEKTEGSAIRRIGYISWLRNLAVALGNAPSDEKILAALKKRLTHPSDLVREHVEWALAAHSKRKKCER